MTNFPHISEIEGVKNTVNDILLLSKAATTKSKKQVEFYAYCNILVYLAFGLCDKFKPCVIYVKYS